MQTSTLLKILSQYQKNRGLLRRLFTKEAFTIKAIKAFANKLGKVDRALTDDELFDLAKLLIAAHEFHEKVYVKGKSENLRVLMIGVIETAIEPEIWNTLEFLSKLQLLNKENFLAVYHHPKYQKQLNEVLGLIDEKSIVVHDLVHHILNQLKRWDSFYALFKLLGGFFEQNVNTKRDNDDVFLALCKLPDLAAFHKTLQKHLQDPLLTIAQHSKLLIKTLLDFHEFAGVILKLLSPIAKQEEKFAAIKKIDDTLRKLSKSHQEISFLHLKGANRHERKQFILTTLQASHQNPQENKTIHLVPFDSNHKPHDFFPEAEKSPKPEHLSEPTKENILRLSS